MRACKSPFAFSLLVLLAQSRALGAPAGAAPELVLSAPSSQTAHAASIRQVPALARRFRADTVIFDLDDTLIRPRHSLGTQRWFDELLGALQGKPGSKQKAFASAVRVWDLVHQKSRMRPVERKTPATVKRLKRAHRVLALTARDGQLVEPTLRSLRQSGMSLDRGTERVDLGRGAYYKDGVIFAGSPANKLYALKAYQRRFGQSRRVVFVDDSAQNIRSLVKGLRLPVLGVHYQGASRANARYSSAVARCQLLALKRKGRIPSDLRVKVSMLGARAKRWVRRGIPLLSAQARTAGGTRRRSRGGMRQTGRR